MAWAGVADMVLVRCLLTVRACVRACVTSWPIQTLPLFCRGCFRCIALVPDLSPTAPIVSVLPLLFVITVTMAKQVCGGVVVRCRSAVVRWCGGELCGVRCACAVLRWCGGAVVRWWCRWAVVRWCAVVVRWCGGAVVRFAVCSGVTVTVTVTVCPVP